LHDHAASISPGERRRLLDVVSDGVARLELLVRRLVQLARADMMRAGNGETDVACVRSVLTRVADRYRARGMVVVVKGEAGAVRLSDDALDALLTSMLENAATHAPGAEVTIFAEIAGDAVCITIRDDGPGIPPAHHDRAFEPFFTTARAQGGTGLGLPIVRAIASGVGGSVTLMPGVTGTEFIIRLPAGRAGR
jgi:signal transduction histidine kinase